MKQREKRNEKKNWGKKEVARQKRKRHVFDSAKKAKKSSCKGRENKKGPCRAVCLVLQAERGGRGSKITS